MKYSTQVIVEFVSYIFYLIFNVKSLFVQGISNAAAAAVVIFALPLYPKRLTEDDVSHVCIRRTHSVLTLPFQFKVARYQIMPARPL